MKTIFKDLLVIGSGPAGLMCAIAANGSRKVTLVEKPAKEFKLGRRILVSGNGRCNFFNDDLLHYEKFSKQYHPFLNQCQGQEFLNFLKENHFAFTKEGNLYYPFFKRSECMHSFLNEKLDGVEIIPGKAIEYSDDGIILLIDGQKVKYQFNDVVLALGGRSLDRDDFTYELLDSLQVKYIPYSPCLCPVRVKERIPSYLNKNRLACHLTLTCGKEIIYSESGEVLFKEDGISGICVFNSTVSLHDSIRKGTKGPFVYHLDYSDSTIDENTDIHCLPLFLQKYLKENHLRVGQELTFTFKDFYPFKESQLSYGGVALDELDENFALKRNPKIHLLGEMLDINLICGGYNMGMAFIQGLQCGKKLGEKL